MKYNGLRSFLNPPVGVMGNLSAVLFKSTQLNMTCVYLNYGLTGSEFDDICSAILRYCDIGCILSRVQMQHKSIITNDSL